MSGRCFPRQAHQRAKGCQNAQVSCDSQRAREWVDSEKEEQEVTCMPQWAVGVTPDQGLVTQGGECSAFAILDSRCSRQQCQGEARLRACITARRATEIYKVTSFEKYQAGIPLFSAASKERCAP